MRNKRQLVSGFVLAAILGSAMPLSADTGATIANSVSRCAVVLGLSEKGLPELAVSILWSLFGCQ